MPFDFTPLRIPGLVQVTPKVFGDARGFFMESYKRSAFAAHGIEDEFLQDNFSHSAQGVLRGLHYQKQPAAQAKLVRVVHGAVFDVVVDLRRGSPTYGEWEAVTLTDEGRAMLYIPVGCAHGFCVLSEAAAFSYKVSAEYAPDLDRGLRWDDPALGIAWPVSDPLLSEKDAALPLLSEADHDFKYDNG